MDSMGYGFRKRPIKAIIKIKKSPYANKTL
jgi:hypothetical protein